MKVRLLNLWENLRSSYWFLPMLMTVAGAVVALLLIGLDHRLQSGGGQYLGWIYQVQPEGARAVLSTLAGSMITVAGVVFSVMVVALSLASQQFGPRLLLGYMRDAGNQAVFGTFTAIFVYCLVVLRGISGGDAAFVPHFAVTFGAVLGVVGVFVLIYFIHHAAVSIQVGHVIKTAGDDLDAVIRSIFPEDPASGSGGDGGGAGESGGEEAGGSGGTIPPPEGLGRGEAPVPADGSGYLQEIDREGLVKAAAKADALVRLRVRIGDYVTRGNVLATVSPEGSASDTLASSVNAAFILSQRRVSPWDLERALGQMAEIAVRALSPGVNDPSTAVAVIERLGASLELLGRRSPPRRCTPAPTPAPGWWIPPSPTRPSSTAPWIPSATTAAGTRGWPSVSWTCWPRWAPGSASGPCARPCEATWRGWGVPPDGPWPAEWTGSGWRPGPVTPYPPSTVGIRVEPGGLASRTGE